MLRWFLQRRQARTRHAAREAGAEIVQTHRPTAPGTLAAVARAGPLVAHRARRHLIDAVRRAIDVADLRVLLACEPPTLAAQDERMLIAVALAVLDALVRVLGARGPPARRAGRHLIRGVDRVRLEGAVRDVRLADESPRLAAAPQVTRTMDVLIHGAGRAMGLAHRAAARRALRHFVAPDELVRAALAMAQTISAQPARTTRCIIARHARVIVADRAATARALRDAIATGSVVAVDTCRFVRRAMGLAARAARPGVLRARRGTVDMAGGGAVVAAECLVAHGAGRRARVAGDVTRPADAHALRVGRSAARAGERPLTTAIQPSRRDEPTTLLPSAPDLPLGAFDEQLPLRELHRMDDDANAMPAFLFRTTTRVLGLVGALRGVAGRLG